MKMMRSGASRILGAVVALGVLTALGAVEDLTAQQTPQARAECRCVDQNGNEIANCACLRSPRGETQVARAFSMLAGRPRIGVTVSTEQDEADNARGARIQSVMEGGPADDAGLQEGDVITRVDGKGLLEPLAGDAEDEFDLDRSIPAQRLLAIGRALEADQDVTIEYLRGTERRTATLRTEDLRDYRGFRYAMPEGAFDMRDMERLGERMKGMRFQSPEGDAWFFGDSAQAPGMFFRGRGGDAVRVAPDGLVRLRSWECPGGANAEGPFLRATNPCVGGLALVTLNPGLAEYFGATRGVLVTDVHEDSALGLRPGDVILSVGDREAVDPERVRSLLTTYDEDEAITLRILRERREMSVQGRLVG